MLIGLGIVYEVVKGAPVAVYPIKTWIKPALAVEPLIVICPKVTVKDPVAPKALPATSFQLAVY